MRRNLALCLLTLSLIATACGGSSDNANAVVEADVESAAAQSSDSAPLDNVPSTGDPAADDPAAGTSTTVPTPGPTPTPSGPRVAADIDPASVPTGQARDFGPAPEVSTGDLAPDVAEAIDTLMGERLSRRVIDQLSFDAITTLGQSGDVRVSWWLADLMRIIPDPDLSARLVTAQQELLGIEIDPFRPWGFTSDLLIGWDIPAPPDYLTYKRIAYLAVEPRWEPLFEEGTDIDWRLIQWGGVLIDDRPFGRTDDRCNCIPAADNPITTDVAGGDEWLGEDTIVFGVSINGEHRAYPRSIMEVREMVNDSLGDRDFAMPYCTLCGSAQVFFTDEGPAGFA
ncbi:MAG: DUF3179 domain-containing protein, partial [Acidimicrobiaceae bacterium]|nr:DUF3179 domain-containing protein [Acidimicrobiaceae bacterium]